MTSGLRKLFQQFEKFASDPPQRRRIREIFWVGLGYAVATAGQVVGVRILTGMMTPSEYGELTLGVSIALLIQAVVFAPAAQSTTRFFAPASERKAQRQYFAAVESLGFKTVVVYLGLSALVLVLLRIIHLGRWLPISLAAAAYAAVFGVSTILNGTQNAARQRPVVAWHGGMEALLRAGYSATLVLFLGSHSAIALSGYFLASLTVLLSQWWFYRRLKAKVGFQPGDPVSSREFERQMVRFGSPLILLGVLTWLQSSADRWSLEAFQNSAAVGRYQALYQIAYQPLFLVSGFLTQLVGPILCARAGDGTDSKRLKSVARANLKIVALIFAVTLCAAAAFVVMPLRVFSLMLGARFRQDLEWAPVLVGSGGVYAMTQIATLSLLASNATRRLILPRVSTCAVSVSASALGARFWGLPGVVVGNLAAAILTCVWIQFLAFRCLWRPTHFPQQTSTRLANASSDGPSI